MSISYGHYDFLFATFNLSLYLLGSQKSIKAYETMKQKYKKTAQEIQDEIFRKMSAAKKLKLASDFSMFILNSRRSATDHGFPRTHK